MKKAFLIALFAALLAGSEAIAQSFDKTKKLTESEVPVVVIKSFQKDYIDLKDKGYWKLHYSEKTVGGKTVFTPGYYSFNAKKDGERVVLTFTTDGTLESSKGTGTSK